MIKNILLLLFAFVLNFSTSYAQELSSPFMLDSEYMEVTTFENKTLKELSKTSIDIKKETSQEGNFFVVTKKGKGHIDRYENALWIIEAHLKEDNGILQTINSICHIKNEEGKTLVIYKKLYDHEKGIISWESYDENGRLKKRSSFPIKGKTCDDVTLMFFLKAFMPMEGKKEKIFYLLTNEPKLFKTKIKFIGKEKLKLPAGEFDAIKVKLTADIGILDDVLDKFVPKTYMWYSATPPYIWLKYQGFEKDSGSHYVVKILQ